VYIFKQTTFIDTIFCISREINEIYISRISILPLKHQLCSFIKNHKITASVKIAKIDSEKLPQKTFRRRAHKAFSKKHLQDRVARLSQRLYKREMTQEVWR